MLDAHQHFWRYNPVKDPWITDEMAVLRRDFMPNDLHPLLVANGFSGCIAVQADQSESETQFLIDLAGQYDFIRGVVGWVDLCAENVSDRLAFWQKHTQLKGFRHILQGEQPDFMLQPDFNRGIQRLKAHQYSFDILVYPRHLSAVGQLVRRHQDQPFILDHMAKPYIKRGLVKQWQRDILSLAQYDHVYCKVSGLVTENRWEGWEQADFEPYLDVVFEAFGSKRVVYGSDWPVCLLAGDYADQKSVVTEYISHLSMDEQIQFWEGNGKAFYRCS